MELLKSATLLFLDIYQTPGSPQPWSPLSKFEDFSRSFSCDSVDLVERSIIKRKNSLDGQLNSHNNNNNNNNSSSSKKRKCVQWSTHCEAMNTEGQVEQVPLEAQRPRSFSVSW